MEVLSHQGKGDFLRFSAADDDVRTCCCPLFGCNCSYTSLLPLWSNVDTRRTLVQIEIKVRIRKGTNWNCSICLRYSTVAQVHFRLRLRRVSVAHSREQSIRCDIFAGLFLQWRHGIWTCELSLGYKTPTPGSTWRTTNLNIDVNKVSRIKLRTGCWLSLPA